jgi:N-hydroxyarylamine O-acetyltransferase
MNVQACLDRVGYKGPTEVSHSTLRGLQQAFLYTVPFENLDIHIGRRIEFTPESVFRKIVEERRGGFCYELNTLFHSLLSEIGFTVHFFAARMVKDGIVGREFGHMILGVDLEDGRWLVDVGNGKSTREPMRFDETRETRAEDVSYRMQPDAIRPSLLEKLDGGEWRTRFIFDPVPRDPSEFLPACHWTQTSAESHFTQNRICTVARPDGRILLMNLSLAISGPNGLTQRELHSDEYCSYLKSHFDINIEPALFFQNRML